MPDLTEHGEATTAPDGLLDAFEAYETALKSNDIAVLNDLFAPGEDTVRGDGNVLLVGHEAIAGFRAGRTRIPTRRVTRLLVQHIRDDAALVMAATEEPSNRATGLQTQLWQRIEGAWKITAAHVTLPKRDLDPSPVFDRAVWRVAGTPLVAPTGSGRLDGLTVAVKDLFAVAGQAIGAGNPTWLSEQHPQESTAPSVTALLRAGAAITGIARTDEFAYSLAGQNAHYGTTPNPAVPDGIGGGSTSGPAAAVALRQVDIGLGTDTAGSIRVPASYQGLIGVRPTHGAVPTTGVLPLSPSFDTVGWLTRDLGSARRAAEVLVSGTSTAAPARTLILPAVEAHASASVRAALAARRGELLDAGRLPPAVTEDLPPETLDRWFTAFRTVQAYEAWHHHGPWISAHAGALGDAIERRFTAASTVTASEAEEASQIVAQARSILREWLTDSVLVLPSTASSAPARKAPETVIETERAGTLRLTCLAGLAGAPAISMPLLSDAAGRPVGLCLVGHPGTDLALFDLAATVQETR
ncbi:AtzH-like domain-containing protein [Glycomyces sp. NPDC048151]|uniref:AtzH-like domain-containing protein n=1 Tax=Glycomyces sp. NPDC048151 TaxID=3364002 RepID=UPI00371DC8FB